MTTAARSMLFFIPARGGSKGLPRKNVLPLAGKPLIAHVLSAIGEARRLLPQLQSRVVVSTDDEEIATVARAWGAEVPALRPAEMARDDSSAMDAVYHMLEVLGRSGFQPEAVFLSQPTSPLVDAADIVEAIRVYEATGRSVVSVTPNEHPFEWSYLIEDGRLRAAVDWPFPAKRQDARTTYRFNGAIWIATRAHIESARQFESPDMGVVVMPADRSVDIDTQTDLELAELILAAKTAPASPFAVGPHRVGPGAPCFVIAEAGVNHNGSLEMALQLVDAARAAGAHAVKFQTFRAEKLVSGAARKADYQIANTHAEGSQFAMLKALELSPEAHRRLIAYCAEKGIVFLSTPFDEESADLLERFEMCAYKISSGEVTNLPFLTHIARKGKPVIVSTGMSTLAEVELAVRTLRAAGARDIVVLQCVTNYPADPADINLRAMQTMASALRVPIGYSDHTLGAEVSLAAVALGACVIEKHFTLSRSLPGPDHAASAEPGELRRLVEAIRMVELSLGDGEKRPAASELTNLPLSRKSLHWTRDLAAGECVQPRDVVALRPATGLAPVHLPALLERRLVRAVKAGEQVAFSDLEGLNS